MIYFIAFLLLLNNSNCLVHHLPVFLTDDGVLKDTLKFPVNPFSILNSTYFSDLVEKVQDLSEAVIFFIEDHFCTEDISTKDFIGTPYPYLRQSFLDRKTAYLPKVIDPYTILRHQYPADDLNTFHLRSSATKLRLDRPYKYLYIFFVDGLNETRVATLRRHDSMMMTVLFAIRQLASGPVTAFYTGKRNLVDIKSDYPSSAHADSPIWQHQYCGNATFRFYDLKLVNGLQADLLPISCSYYDNDWPSFEYEIIFDSYVNKIKGKEYKMKFYFYVLQHEKGWRWTELEWSTEKISRLFTHTVNVESPWDETYTSGKSIVLAPVEWYEPKCMIGNLKIYLSSKLIQNASTTTRPPPMLALEMSNFRADDDNKAEEAPTEAVKTTEVTSSVLPNQTNSTKTTTVKPGKGKMEKQKAGKGKFVTEPILTGLMVSFMLISILLWGVQMLMGCGTNNRLDSSDTKPLQQEVRE